MKAFYSLLFGIVLVQPLWAETHHHNHEHHQQESMQSEQASLPGDSLYNLDSEWITSRGESLGLQSLPGPVRIVAMLYTSCQTACPMITHEMKNILSKLPDNLQNSVHMSLFSFDPKRDTPQALEAFKEKLNLRKGHWDLYSPKNDSSVNELAAALGVQFKRLDDGEYIHSNTIYLLSSDGRILARKEGLGSSPEQFIKEIKRHAR